MDPDGYLSHNHANILSLPDHVQSRVEKGNFIPTYIYFLNWFKLFFALLISLRILDFKSDKSIFSKDRKSVV